LNFATFAETLLFVGVVHWFGDIWKMLFFKQGVRWKLVLLFGIPGVALALAASSLPAALPETSLKQALGIFLVSYVVFLYFKPKWKLKETLLNAIIGGGLSGVFAGLFGAGGAIRGTFLSAFNLQKAVYIFTSGAIAIMIDSARLVGYSAVGIRLSDFTTQMQELILPSAWWTLCHKTNSG
jgi:hypothetical protein